jgi:hypothetical protein
LIVGIAGVSYQPLVAVEGVATRNGSLLKDTNLVFGGNGRSFRTLTGPSGAFRLPPSQPGLYKVSVVSSSKPDHPEDGPAKTAIAETPKLMLKQGPTSRRVAGKSPRRAAGPPPPEIDATARWFTLEDDCEDVKLAFP